VPVQSTFGVPCGRRRFDSVGRSRPARRSPQAPRAPRRCRARAGQVVARPDRAVTSAQSGRGCHPDGEREGWEERARQVLRLASTRVPMVAGGHPPEGRTCWGSRPTYSLGENLALPIISELVSPSCVRIGPLIRWRSHDRGRSPRPTVLARSRYLVGHGPWL
jgi:hypothetical protein